MSVFRTYESHVMQVRPWLPQEIGRVTYVALGMSDLGVYLPYYYGLDKFIDGYDKGSYKAYKEFEDALAVKQAKFENEYVKLYKKDKAKANKLLNEFSINMMKEAKALTQNLTNEIFTMLTDDTDAKLKSLNKGKKD